MRLGHRIALFAALVVTTSSVSLPSGVAEASVPGTAHSQLPAVVYAANISLITASSLAKLQETAETRLKDIYGSIEVNGGGVIVYLTQLQLAAEKSLRDLGGPIQVRFARTAHSRLHLLAVHQKLTAAFGSLAARGIRIVSWFPGINGDGMEHVGVLNLTPAKVAVLNGLLGAQNIILSNVTTSQVPQSTANRNNDYAPWSGGDNETGAGNGCTAGAGIIYYGEQYMVTAAHCYLLGASVYNEFPHVIRPYNFMGTVVSRDMRYDGDDTELVRMPVSGYIWTGTIGLPVRVAVSGVAANPDGDTVYNEGAFSGQVAATVRSDYLGCISTTERGAECNIVEATSAGIANQSGDSGAPVIRYIGGRLMVAGIVSAGSQPTACRYNTQYSNACYHVLFYTAMDEILSTEYPGALLAG
jgi:hypothetical protein